MISAVRLVLAGGVYVPPLILPALSADLMMNDQPPPPADPATSHSQDEFSEELHHDHDYSHNHNHTHTEPTRDHNEPTRESLRNMLTDRQIEVLDLLSQGKPNKLIGRALGINEGTVKIHLAAIFRVLNVSNRTEAVVKARSL